MAYLIETYHQSYEGSHTEDPKWVQTEEEALQHLLDNKFKYPCGDEYTEITITDGRDASVWGEIKTTFHPQFRQKSPGRYDILFSRGWYRTENGLESFSDATGPGGTVLPVTSRDSRTLPAEVLEVWEAHFKVLDAEKEEKDRLAQEAKERAEFERLKAKFGERDI